VIALKSNLMNCACCCVWRNGL